jgi:Fur family ferric uptake transcriptional regulator
MSRILKCGREAPVRRKLQGEDLQAIRVRLESYLRERQLRFTEPRWKVAESILLSGLHLESRDIVSAVKKRDPGVGEATVYRAIRLLCDAAILEESHHSASGRTVYEIADDEHHDHILCTDCGEVFEFHDEALERLQEETARSQGFSLVGHRHVLMGKCSFKQQKGKRA